MKSIRLAIALLLISCFRICLLAQATDEEVKAFYDENPSMFTEPEMVRAAHILISNRDPETGIQFSGEAKQAKLKLAETLVRRARSGEDFAKLVREYSDDPGSKHKGGEYTFSRGKMVPEFETAAFSLGTNEISDVVGTIFGYHIVKLVEKIPARKPTLAEATPKIREYLAQRNPRENKPRPSPEPNNTNPRDGWSYNRTLASGTGFFISNNGYLISNNHVVKDATHISLVTSGGLISAQVVKVDAANDLALLKAEGRFAALPVAASRGVKLGGTVATVGFPNIGLQGFAPKFAKGEIASLSGARDDARYFQISVPVQPGNSGGALVDVRGNVVGVVSAKLDASAALRSSGALPENVNYAIKSSYLLNFLESVPEVANKLKEPSIEEKKFEDLVKEAEQAAVLVLVY